MASGCVPGSGGRRAGLGRRSYLTRFIADLPQDRYTGSGIEYL